MNPAGVDAFEENTLPVRLVDDGKAAAFGVQAGVVLDEVILRHVQMRGDGAGFISRHIDIAGPAAAVPTAHALVMRRGSVKQ